MDGRQVQQQLANNSGRGSYHYGPNNSSFNSESSLESIQVNAGNSIQFIDSQGCPTDANIMGPLVKMDTNGHRILAPFDAFKFPTSDMVFFRAVVSSCIAECKPVLCNSYDQELSSAAATTTPASFTTKKTTPVAYLASSTVAPNVRHHHNHHHHHAHNQHHFGGSDSPTNMATTSRRNNIDTVMSSRLSTTILPSSAQTNRPLSASSSNLDLIYTTLSDFSDLNLPLTKQGDNQDGRLSSGEPFSSTLAPSLSHNGQQQQTWDQNVGQNSSIDMTTNNSNTSDHKPSKQSLEGQRTNQVIPAGDSLTTVPGFAQQLQPQENASTSTIGDASNQQQLVVNMTNNHQLGKAPLRPTMSPSMGDKTIGPPIDLNKLSQEQKQQLVKLFESKLKQPFERNDNASISEMADFYTGFLTSIMMNRIEGSDLELAEKKRQQVQVQDQLEQHKQVASMSRQQQQIEDNYKRNEKLAQLLGEHKLGSTNHDINIRPAEVELDSLPSPHLLKLRLNKTIELVAAEITRLLQKQLASHDDQQDVANLHPLSNKQSQSDNLNNFTKNNLSDNYYNDLATQATSTSNSTMLILPPPPQFASQQNLDSTNRSVIKPPLGSSSRLKTRTTETVGGASNNNNRVKTNLAHQGAKLASITKVSGQEVSNEIKPALPASSSGSTSTSASAAQIAKLKKANLQALADSYLGAYQPPFNKRRNKRRRRRSIKESGNLSLFPGYVYLEQAQEATLAPSLFGHTDVEARFTQGIVEMYHTTSGSINQINYLTKKQKQNQKQHQVRKRDITNQHFYDVDEELVVQSIKIVDRLQFPDEESQNSGDELRGDGNKSTHRSQTARPSNLSSGGHNYGLKGRSGSSSAAAVSGFQDKLDKLDEESELPEDGEDHFKSVSLSSSGALSLIIITLSFVFVQIFLVVICLLDWNRHKISSANKRKNSARSSQDLSSIDYSSTISNIGCKPQATLSRANSVSSMYIYLYK